MKKFLLLISILIVGIIFFWKMKPDESQVFQIVVLPHHGITWMNIDSYYKNLQQEFWSFERIVIVSPDHFAKLRFPIETVSTENQKICYSWKCVQSLSLENNLLQKNAITKIIAKNGNTNEHGIWEHIMRIAQFFPQAKVTPLFLKRKLVITNEEKEIAEMIGNLKEKKILVIASVDFSHHVREEVAKWHDAIAVESLHFRAPFDFNNLEVDCRNCLAVVAFLAHQKKFWDFSLQNRTSVDTILKVASGIENTSHIFGKFISSDVISESDIFTIYMYDFTGNENFSDIFRKLHMHYELSKNPTGFYYRLFSWFDEWVMVVDWELKNQKNFELLQNFAKIKIINREDFYNEMRLFASQWDELSFENFSFAACQRWKKNYCENLQLNDL